MAITQEQLDALEQSVIDRKGVIFATFGDQQMSFENSAAMRAFIAEERRKLAAAAAGGSTTRYAATRKGV